MLCLQQTAAAAIILNSHQHNKDVAKLRFMNVTGLVFVVLLDPVILPTAIFHFSKPDMEKLNFFAHLTLSLWTQTTLSQKPSKPLRIWEERGLHKESVNNMLTLYGWC